MVLFEVTRWNLGTLPFGYPHVIWPQLTNKYVKCMEGARAIAQISFSVVQTTDISDTKQILESVGGWLLAGWRARTFNSWGWAYRDFHCLQPLVLVSMLKLYRLFEPVCQKTETSETLYCLLFLVCCNQRCDKEKKQCQAAGQWRAGFMDGFSRGIGRSQLSYSWRS